MKIVDYLMIGATIRITAANYDYSVPAPSDRPPRVAWKAFEILVVFTTASKKEGTCPMKVKQSLAWYV